MPKPSDMVYLLLSVLSSAFIIVLFKLIGRHKVDTLSAIVVNYPVACLAGFFLTDNFHFSQLEFGVPWLPVAAFLGVLFIVMFWFIGTSTKMVGISITTVAAKMSIIIPIAYSIWIDPADSLTLIKVGGIGLAVVALVLSVYQGENRAPRLGQMAFPIIIFLGLGLLDSIVKFAQFRLLTPENVPLFTGASFGFAFAAGLMIVPFSRAVQNNLLKPKTLVYGVPLGLLNFGSIYFLIKALNHVSPHSSLPADSSIVFGINNISIVAVSVLIGIGFFGERPTKVNWFGFFLSVTAIAILAYAKFLE